MMMIMMMMLLLLLLLLLSLTTSVPDALGWQAEGSRNPKSS